MNKKAKILYALAVLLLLSSFSGFSSGNVSGGFYCIVISAVLFFFGYRSHVKKVSHSPSSEPSDTKSINNTTISENPEFIFEEITVSGVTFKNGRKSRQTILRAIKFRDEPYTDGLNLALEHYLYEDKDAYYVTVNSEPIGNIPADKVQYVKSLLVSDKIVALSHIDVYGGGRDTSGKPISFGAKITLKIKNS